MDKNRKKKLSKVARRIPAGRRKRLLKEEHLQKMVEAMINNDTATATSELSKYLHIKSPELILKEGRGDEFMNDRMDDYSRDDYDEMGSEEDFGKDEFRDEDEFGEEDFDDEEGREEDEFDDEEDFDDEGREIDFDDEEGREEDEFDDEDDSEEYDEFGHHDPYGDFRSEVGDDEFGDEDKREFRPRMEGVKPKIGKSPISKYKQGAYKPKKVGNPKKKMGKRK